KNRFFILIVLIFTFSNIFSDNVLGTKIDKKNNKTADLILFSYDRPMQLMAFLESIEKNVEGIGSIFVIYRSSDGEYEKGYKIVKDTFEFVKFLKQENPPYDFKELLLYSVFDNSSSDYFSFGVDDMIVTDPINFSECIDYLEEEKAYCFSLRLGTNIVRCYTINQDCGNPLFTKIENGIYKWQFCQGKGDWSLAASTDMTVYRKKDFNDLFNNLEYKNPNVFEALWIANADNRQFGICYEFSKVINIPVNIVQDQKWHRAMNFLDTKELLEEFLDGTRIDIHEVAESMQKKRNESPHIAYVPHFIFQ
ncbi:hypothetical protein ACFLYH_02725, partial [Candidatus Dependentiae bacterium]